MIDTTDTGIQTKFSFRWNAPCGSYFTWSVAQSWCLQQKASSGRDRQPEWPFGEVGHCKVMHRVIFLLYNDIKLRETLQKHRFMPTLNQYHFQKSIKGKGQYFSNFLSRWTSMVKLSLNLISNYRAKIIRNLRQVKLMPKTLRPENNWRYVALRSPLWEMGLDSYHERCGQ